MEKLRPISDEMRASLKPGDSLGQLTAKYPTVSVGKAQSFTLGGFISGIGRDPTLMGSVATMQAGEISKPIESTRGMYLFKMISKSSIDSVAFNAQKDALWGQILQEKRSRVFTEWADQLKKKSEIVDNRDLFYR